MKQSPRLAAVSPRAKSRKGVALLMLVVLVALVALGATHSLVQNEIQTRRGNQRWIRAQVLTAAIEQARQVELSSEIPLLLPVGGDDEFLEVRKNDVSSEIIVRWIRGGEVIDEMIRKVAPPPTDSEKIQ